jgi:hypothetical protein
MPLLTKWYIPITFYGIYQIKDERWLENTDDALIVAATR